MFHRSGFGDTFLNLELYGIMQPSVTAGGFESSGGNGEKEGHEKANDWRR